MNDLILIDELEVFVLLGVPDEERAKPQRILVSLEMQVDVAEAAATDDLAHTVDYYAIVCELREFVKSRSWKLIETLACDVAQLALRHTRVSQVTVELSKFIIPDTRRVAVRVTRARTKST